MSDDKIDNDQLMEYAKKAALKAYAPYSNFRVGAALLVSENRVITGCNVENRSFGLTNCAERTAIFKAVSEGFIEFKTLALYCPDADYPVSPCGACRQVLGEFAGKDFPIEFECSTGERVSVVLSQLLPYDALHELKKEK